MKNYDSSRNAGIPWNEFKVIARNCHQAIRFENSAPGIKMRDFSVQESSDNSISILDTGQILNYPFMEDDFTHMEEFRVKRINERFGFSAENPSDVFYKEKTSH
jgi:hypothetical protein